MGFSRKSYNELVPASKAEFFLATYDASCSVFFFARTRVSIPSELDKWGRYGRLTTAKSSKLIRCSLKAARTRHTCGRVSDRSRTASGYVLLRICPQALDNSSGKILNHVSISGGDIARPNPVQILALTGYECIFRMPLVTWCDRTLVSI